MEKKIDGTVTGPINKAAIHAAGHQLCGAHRDLCDPDGHRDYSMMLTHGNFRITHVSTHVSLREACDRVKRDRVMRVIELTWDAFKTLGYSGHASVWPV